MTPDGSAWMRRILAAAAGGLVAGAFIELVAYPALEIVGRGWELGAVPFLLAQVAFAPVLAALIAGLAHPDRVYLTALLSQGALAAFAILVAETRANPGVSFIAVTPFGIPLALWGALLVDAHLGGRAQALAPLRDISYIPAYFLTLCAIFPPAIFWLPAPFGAMLAVAAPAAFFIGLAGRNRRIRAREREGSSV